MFTGILVGIGVGVVGALLDWHFITTVFVAFFLGILLTSTARSDSTKAFSALKTSTVHLAVGSGSIVKGPSGKQYILTNSHVCNYAKWKGTLTAFYEDGTTVTGQIVKDSFAIDLCAARVEKQTAALKLGHILLPLQKIYTRGYPGHILSQSEGRVGLSTSWGYAVEVQDVGECPIVSEKIRDVRGSVVACGITFRSTLTSLYSRPGSSGSPVVDASGNLIGVISSLHIDGEFNAGMVMFRDLQNFLKDL